MLFLVPKLYFNVQNGTPTLCLYNVGLEHLLIVQSTTPLTLVYFSKKENRGCQVRKRADVCGFCGLDEEQNINFGPNGLKGIKKEEGCLSKLIKEKG